MFVVLFPALMFYIGREGRFGQWWGGVRVRATGRGNVKV